MGVLDPLFDALAGAIDTVDDASSAITNPDIEGVDLSALVADLITEASALDEAGTILAELGEETITGDLREVGAITAENSREVADETEGNALALLLGLASAGGALEAASLGQIDEHQEYLTQALVGLGVDDVTGKELEARMSEGLEPALQAQMSKEHRAKFVNLQDAVEYALRRKQGDRDYLSPANAPADVQRLIGSNQPENPENLIEEWGIRDDNLEILEETAINSMEFEELIETPSELGLIVPDDVLEAELDRAGYSEATKSFLSKVNNRIDRSARAYDQLLVTEELVSQLDTLVQEGVLEPEAAVARVPEQVPVDGDALRERFVLLQEQEAGAPSQSELEDAFTLGQITPEQFRSGLSQREFPVRDFEGVYSALVLGEADGQLRTAVGLGLMNEADYVDLLTEAGLDEQTVEQLLQGQDLDKIALKRLQETEGRGSGALEGLPQIGEERASLLRSAGLESVDAVATADPEIVADALAVSPEFAARLIQAARIRASGDS
jgi:hypothetical protein